LSDKVTISVPAFELPPSSYLSEEARESVIAAATTPGWVPGKDATIADIRRGFDMHTAAPRLKRAQARYAVMVEEQRLGGVRVDVVVPDDGVAPENRDRVLINLHGGGFRAGGGLGGLVESIPISATAQIKVISVDYRMSPEHQHPAASEDVAQVYTRLLEDYRPECIGIYGCSAGGVLTAMAVAWIAGKGMPRPGALGLLCACADATLGGGDSLFTATAAQGRTPPPSTPNPPLVFAPLAYIGDADRTDPLLCPVASDVVLAAFPPTLVVTASRDFEMSAATYAHRRLLAAGVTAQLIVWDGLGHGFFYDVDLPESRECFASVSRFFRTHLG
jgi:monoterpene epsilon-lactone hydrolase